MRTISFVAVLLTLVMGCAPSGEQPAEPGVSVTRVPDQGIQPQAVVDGDIVHLIYFKGDAGAGDVFYVRRSLGDEDWSEPVRVNSGPGSVIATGTVRGAHLAVGRNGRVHVAWMGSRDAAPRGPGGAAPMLYARMDENEMEFEPQRNVMQFAVGLDGGGSIAVDRQGGVFVAWHGRGDGEDEAGRRVWLARSQDDGSTFAREVPAYEEPTGACGCCGMRAFADTRGKLHLLYRTAEENLHRGMQLVTLEGGETAGLRLDDWELSACPMTTSSIRETGGRVLAAWENAGQVFFARIDGATAREPIPAPGATGARKHPVAVGNDRGETLLVWTEGTGWNRGGSLVWHVFDADGKPTLRHGTEPDVAVWSLPTALVDATGDFVIVY